MQSLLDDLRAVVGQAHVLAGDAAALTAYERDWRKRYRGHALAVVAPGSTDEVAAVVRLCAAADGISIVAQGGNTGLVGDGVPDGSRRQVVLSTRRLRAVRRIDADNQTITVEAGLVLQEVQAAAAEAGLLFPLSLAAEGTCTIGGNLATNAGGTQVLRFGNARELCLGLEVVTAQGEVWSSLHGLRKDNTGYDLRDLFVGSEGTLGIITEIQLRLHGIPEAMSAAICQFDTLAGAVESVIAILQAGIPIARIELLDDVQMNACIAFSKLEGYRDLPTLLLEFHGTTSAVAEQAALAQDITAEYGAHGFQWASDATERNRLWKARHDAYWACLALKPGHKGIATDAIVPISRLADLIMGAKEDILASDLTAPIVGHVGDGNFHTVILVPNTEDGIDRAWALDKKIVARALALGGSCSGEHGVGIGKREFLEQEHGPETLALMRQVKAAIDPRGIMNPGKLFLN